MSTATLAGILLIVLPLAFNGWKLAGALTPIAYVAWSVWLLVTGIALLV